MAIARLVGASPSRHIGPPLRTRDAPGTAVVPDTSSNASKESPAGDSGDGGDAAGRIEHRCTSAGGRAVAGSNPVAPTNGNPLPKRVSTLIGNLSGLLSKDSRPRASLKGTYRRFDSWRPSRRAKARRCVTGVPSPLDSRPGREPSCPQPLRSWRSLAVTSMQCYRFVMQTGAPRGAGSVRRFVDAR
jgi:hypothetical protein